MIFMKVILQNYFAANSSIASATIAIAFPHWSWGILRAGKDVLYFRRQAYNAH